MNPPPITASGSASDYTRTFKKHFGNRPTAFALSPHSPSPSGSSSSSPTFNAGERRGRVDIDTQTALANLGWKIRSKVNQGYSRSSTTLSPNLCGEDITVGLKTEREVLSEVKNGRRGWSRVRTAPTIADSFDDLREGDVDMDESPLHSSTTIHSGIAGKRARRNSDSDSDEQQELQREQEGERRIKGLPQLSFSSSISSCSSHSHFSSQSFVPPEIGMKRSLSRSKSSISPFNSNQTMMDDEMQFEAGKLETVEGVGYDFSRCFDNTDF